MLTPHNYYIFETNLCIKERLMIAKIISPVSRVQQESITPAEVDRLKQTLGKPSRSTMPGGPITADKYNKLGNTPPKPKPLPKIAGTHKYSNLPQEKPSILEKPDVFNQDKEYDDYQKMAKKKGQEI
jgi:hypothetical protein